MKIMALNMQGGRGVTKGYFEYVTSFYKSYFPSSSKYVDAAARFLKEEDADLILVTEVDNKAFRSNFTDQSEVLNGLLKYHKAFFPATRFGSWWIQGNTIFSRFPIIRSVSHLLPGKGESRILGEVTIDHGGIELTAYVTHLSLNKAVRLEQIKRIADIWKAQSGLKILGGDLNTADPAEVTRIGATQMVTGKTFPSWNPKKELDYILLSPEFMMQKSYTISDPLVSDHLPLIVEASI